MNRTRKEQNVLLSNTHALRLGVQRALENLGDLSLGALALFLYVAEEPELSQKEYADRLGVGKSTISAQTLRLTDLDAYHRPGPGLIEQVVDPMERRRKLLRLTPKGARLLAQISRSMEGYRS